MRTVIKKISKFIVEVMSCNQKKVNVKFKYI